jgi:hypothetical protein
MSTIAPARSCGHRNKRWLIGPPVPAAVPTGLAASQAGNTTSGTLKLGTDGGVRHLTANKPPSRSVISM